MDTRSVQIGCPLIEGNRSFSVQPHRPKAIHAAQVAAIQPPHACCFWRDLNPKGQDLNSRQIPLGSSSTEMIMLYDKRPYVICPTNWGVFTAISHAGSNIFFA